MWIFWGTTYLGIRIAVETVPPVVLMTARFLLSGGLLLIGALITGARLPRGSELLRTSLYGIITIGIGTGLLVYAETWIPSGLAAIMITTSPFWTAGIDAMLPGGERLHGPTLFGMLIGFLGVGFLLAPDAMDAFAGAGGGAILAGFAVLQLGQIGWTVGALLQRRHATTVHPVISGAVQQFATGLLFLPFALWQHEAVHFTPRATWAIVYLAVFGSVVGYSAFIFTMQRLPVAMASMYTYINPIVAVVLGWLFLREPIGLRHAVAMIITFAGVYLVKRAQAALPVAPAED